MNNKVLFTATVTGTATPSDTGEITGTLDSISDSIGGIILFDGFFDKIRELFQRIVDFFRNLFKK